MAERTGIIDVGGGFRGIYAAGVLDRCLNDGISFDVGIGVSAGSANLASFAAMQPRRNYQFYTEYGLRPQYASMKNFLLKGSYLDLDYVYGTLSNSDGESPLDYQAMMDNPMVFEVVATDAQTGEAVYFDKTSMIPDKYDPFKGSSSIPFICKPYPIKGRLFYDGALGDPVPVQRAFDLGCDKVVVLLTKPADMLRTPGNDIHLAKRIRRKYPIAAWQLMNRADSYNQGVALAKQYAVMGKALIVAPDDTCGVSTLTRDAKKLDLLYRKGYADGAAIAPYMKQP